MISHYRSLQNDVESSYHRQEESYSKIRKTFSEINHRGSSPEKEILNKTVQERSQGR